MAGSGPQAPDVPAERGDPQPGRAVLAHPAGRWRRDDPLGWHRSPLDLDDFSLRSLHGEIEGASLVDWPIAYDDLEKYYTRVEWELGTSASGANRWEAPRSKGYPTKPVNLTHYGRIFAQTMAKMGHSTFPIPQAMVTEPYNGRKPFPYTGFWQQYADPFGAKSSTANTYIPDALATGLLDLRPDCYVKQITTQADGSAKGVVYQDADGDEFEQLADVVIMCAGGIETPRLLHLSANTQHPDGLANSSGLVGANATFHEYLFAIGLFDKEIVDPLYPWAGHYMNTMSFDYYKTDESRGHLLGTLILRRCWDIRSTGRSPAGPRGAGRRRTPTATSSTTA